MTNIQAICWDMDGSLIDNHSVFEESVVLTNTKYSLTYMQEYSVGGCLETLWSCLDNPQKITFELWVQEISRLCLHALSREALRPSVEEMLAFFKDNNIPQSCVSNSPSPMIESNLLKTQIASFFDHWVGRDHVKNGKPHPDPYLHSCSLHKVPPHRSLAIEDTTVGVQAAKTAGLIVIAFPHQRTRSHDFSLADYIIEDLRELKRICRSL